MKYILQLFLVGIIIKTEQSGLPDCQGRTHVLTCPGLARIKLGP